MSLKYGRGSGTLINEQKYQYLLNTCLSPAIPLMSILIFMLIEVINTAPTNLIRNFYINLMDLWPLLEIYFILYNLFKLNLLFFALPFVCIGWLYFWLNLHICFELLTRRLSFYWLTAKIWIFKVLNEVN